MSRIYIFSKLIICPPFNNQSSKYWYLKRGRMTIKFVEEKGKILALGIFMLMLRPNLTKIISLEADAAFITYENT